MISLNPVTASDSLLLDPVVSVRSWCPVFPVLLCIQAMFSSVSLLSVSLRFLYIRLFLVSLVYSWYAGGYRYSCSIRICYEICGIVSDGNWDAGKWMAGGVGVDRSLGDQLRGVPWMDCPCVTRCGRYLPLPPVPLERHREYIGNEEETKKESS